ncbi:tyrosine phosphatase family protein [Lichenibacterium dinghuense]|uniref:tyrosine phosphatase family protein n=1 Tax=Lichenibacterium dinghuense TaxID=2895977 RepID=UPI001F2EF8DD|nr:protein tyrosine phosphatase [Lichenibacterium sp. 6Y81]
MRARVVVCPQSRLADTLAATGARSVVTLLAADQRAGLPPMPGAARLLLDVSDIVSPRDGFALAGEGHVADLLAFARAWDRRHPLLVHCYAGVSRSTAAAFAVACALDPTRDEAVVAAAFRRASPSATPNPRLVALADAALGRSGRMTEAVRAIGRGRDCFEGEVFSLDVPPRG